jgi:acetolactate synthase-1/2/3 large subunit
MSVDSQTQRTGADFLVQELKSKGVDLIFCITGAGNLAIVDAITRDGSIRLIYSHHEQAAVMEAQGYSRVTGKMGVALVTTGGGVANTLTGILSAYLDSIPVLVISGNESSFHCENYATLRAYGVQGFDSVSVLQPVTKSAIRITDNKEIVVDFNRVWEEALTARRGPVLIDFPMDLQRKLSHLEEMCAAAQRELHASVKLSGETRSHIQELSSALAAAHTPLLYIGNGCRGGEEFELLKEFVEREQIPFCLSWSALDLFPADAKLNVGRIGIYGDRAANLALQKADLLLCIGTRLAIPQLGYDRADFGRNAAKWIVEIDPTECSKFAGAGWNLLNMGAKQFLEEIDIAKSAGDFSARTTWLGEIRSLWSALPRMKQVGTLQQDQSGIVHSAEVIEYLNSHLDGDAIIVTDVGAGLLTGHYLFAPRSGQRIFTSQGLGEMGFGLPGAVGAHFGAPKRQLICLDTDGGIMFNLQELQVIAEHKIPMKLFIFNNDGYAMIRISQENLFGARLAGSGISSGVSFPNFENLANTFRLKYVRIDSVDDFSSKLQPALDSGEGVLIEIIMSPTQKYLPRLATSKLEDGTLVSPPLEDLDPFLSLSDLEKYLGYRAHPNSYRARGLSYDVG